jgi:UDP-MurNAc hydroxylase
MLNNDVAEIKILSHACMIAKVGSASVIIDPWLLGSSYWRSWWNFPEAAFDESEVRSVDAVVISHIHWDHWHGPTIKRFLRDKRFIVSSEPNKRSRDDLRRIGVRDVVECKHGDSIEIASGFKLTLYQFGLLMSDTAIVLELGRTRILNANDAKIAGLPLKRLLRKHGAFDFALRSHSSANARACFRVEGETQPRDDASHYARSFKLFMDAVQPKYAVPFASNHCYLHPDTEKFNDMAVNPLRLEQQLSTMGGLEASKLTVMAPGSSWRSDRGFDLSSTEPFEKMAQYVAQYRERQRPALARAHAEELAAEVGSAVVSRLCAHVTRIPKWRRAREHARVLGIELSWPDDRRRFLELDLLAATVAEISEAEAQRWSARMRWPALVFRDIVMKRMYSHGMISKRFEFVGQDAASLGALVSAYGLLDQVEVGLYPLRAAFFGRIAASYVRRWDELIVYVQAAFMIFVKRVPGYHVEEQLLRASKTKALVHPSAITR